MSEYDDLLAEATANAQAFRATAKEYIPKMHAALRKENSNLSPTDARDRIQKDCLSVWSRRTILDALPNEAKNPEKQKSGRLGQRKRNSAAFSAAPRQQKERMQLMIDAKGTPLIEEELSSRGHQTNHNTDSDSDSSSTFDAKEDVQWSRLRMEGNVLSDLGSEKQMEPLKKQVEELQTQHVQDTERITELEAELAKTTSCTTADQMPETEVKEVVVDLEKFGALLFAAIRNRKKRCSIQIDQTGNAI
ncbi:MAG: hypothetical protein M3Y53_01490, partial [Thermoproteota archaeon]|nr:hypothetical protein [Thermoproteota archaeon]